MEKLPERDARGVDGSVVTIPACDDCRTGIVFDGPCNYIESLLPGARMRGPDGESLVLCPGCQAKRAIDVLENPKSKPPEVEQAARIVESYCEERVFLLANASKHAAPVVPAETGPGKVIYLPPPAKGGA